MTKSGRGEYELVSLRESPVPSIEYAPQLENENVVGYVRCACGFTAFLFVAGLFTMFIILLEKNSCLESPYLYITVHDSISNVLKYSRNGCRLHSSVLLGEIKGIQRPELRGMLLDSHHTPERLFIANGRNSSSEVLVYGPCSSFNSRRAFLSQLKSAAVAPNAQHPYGLAMDSSSSTLFVSYQNADAVYRFDIQTLEPIVRSNLSCTDAQCRDGLFYAFDSKGGGNGARGVAFVPRTRMLWIANEAMGIVQLVDVDHSIPIMRLSVKRPIGLYYDNRRGEMFVGSRSNQKGKGKIVVYDAATASRKYQLATLDLQHPAGMTAFEDTLFVADQATNTVETFDLNARIHSRTIIDHLPTVEQLILSHC